MRRSLSGTGGMFNINNTGQGNVLIKRNGLDQDTRYEYFIGGDLKKIDYPTGTDATFNYDHDGRITSMVDVTGTTTWAYDLANRLTNLVQPNGSINYSYDSWGRPTLINGGNGNSIEIHYHPTLTHRLQSIQRNYQGSNSDFVQFQYDSFERIFVTTLGNGSTTNYAFDEFDRIVSVAHKKSDGTGIAAEYYAYNSLGNLISKTVGGFTHHYDYDAVDRLIGEGNLGLNYTEYTYDANGNRTMRKLNGEVAETLSYDGADKLISRTWLAPVSATWNYVYDLAGRLTSIQTPQGNTTLAYNFDDKATSIIGQGFAVYYNYNAAGARVLKSGTGGPKTYLRNGVDVTSPVISDGQSAFLPGFSERSGSNTKALHTDRMGSVTHTTSSNQAVQDSRVYSAFGLPSVGNSSQGYAATWGYLEDGETQLKLLGHRLYDPSLGRFLVRDPIGDGLNWFAYCDNDPLNLVDPEGLEFEFLAGFGDSLTFGGAYHARRLIGHAMGIGDPNELIDTDSIHYKAGELAGDAYGVALSGGLGAAKTGKAIKGVTEFSHFVPKRYFRAAARNLPKRLGSKIEKAGKRRTHLNGNWVTAKNHAKHDPFRKLSTAQQPKLYHPVVRAAKRVPGAYYLPSYLAGKGFEKHNRN